jgi:hypothetical protein
VAQNQPKSRLIRCAALAPVALIAVSLTAGAHGQAARSDSVFSVKGRISILAADGNRAAVSTRVKPGCGRIVVWSAPGKHSISVKPGILGCAGDGVFQLALGGGQVAWIEEGGGNDLELSVMAARLDDGTRKQLEFATNGDRAGGDPAGAWVGRLFGSGPLFAYNSWTQICGKPRDQECGEHDPFLRLTNEKLVRIAAGRRLVAARGIEAYPLLAVGGGRLAVGGIAGLTIRAANGARLATVPYAPSSARAVALRTTRLAVETAQTLDLYNPATGAAVKSLPLGASASLSLVDVGSRLVLLQGQHRLAVIRLSDGKQISFPLRRGAAAALVGGRLTEAGLFYAYNTRGTSLSGRIVFEPMRTLLTRF